MTAAPPPTLRPRWIAVGVALALVAVAATLLWRWYDDPASRADRARDDIEDLPGVGAVIEKGEAPTVGLTLSATTEEVATVLEEAAGYAGLLADAGGPGYVTVRSGDVVAPVGRSGTSLDPALLRAAGQWQMPEGLEIELFRPDDGGTWVHATSAYIPSVTTLAWLSQQVEDLDAPVRAGVDELAATVDGSILWSRLFGPAIRDLAAVQPVLDAIATLAPWQPMATVTAADDAAVFVDVDPADADRARREARRALVGFPGVRVEVDETS